jgi:phospholipid-translocating ATPase
MFNYYRQHIPHFAHTVAPLYKAAESFSWNRSTEEALQALKRKLAAVASLHVPHPTTTFHVHTDASEIAVGAAIHQKGFPLAFFSKVLSPPEQRYSTFDREALAVVMVIRAYRHWFEGARVIIHTDHQPLLSLLQMKDPSPRQTRWIRDLSSYNLEWIYVPGKSNNVADCSADHLLDFPSSQPSLIPRPPQRRQKQQSQWRKLVHPNGKQPGTPSIPSEITTKPISLS